MSDPLIGKMAALATAVCWTLTAQAFEHAGKRVGSLPVNLIRLVLAFFLLSLYTWITRGLPLPLDASGHTWVWLLISGFIGFSLGDLFLFRAFVVVGARISMLIMSLVPPLTALIGWIFMRETLALMDWAGMALTIGGVGLVISQRRDNGGGKSFRHPISGVLLAFGGAVGQAAGLVLSKFGMGSYDAFAATHIRIMAGIAGFLVIFTLRKSWPRTAAALRDRTAMRSISLGAFFGPFLGVSLSLLAVQYIATGVASTFMSIVPVLIIPPAVLFFHEKITVMEIVGALLAVSGIALLFLH